MNKMKMAFISMRSSLRRWLDLLALIVVAILVCVLLYPLIQFLSDRFGQITSPWPIWLQFFITTLISGFLWFLLIRVGGFRWGDLSPDRFIRYPPVWFFSLVGLCVYCWLLSMFPLSDRQVLSNYVNFYAFGYVASSMIVGFATASLFHRFFSLSLTQETSLPLQSADSAGNFQSVLDSPDHLIHWLQEEVPIRQPAQDRFGLSVMAQRISCELMFRELKTIGVVGQYGIGKSSLLNLVEYYLNNPCETSKAFSSVHDDSDFFYGKLLICRVDGWGRIKGSIAQQILTIAIKRLSAEIDCLSVITTPAAYIEALELLKGPLGFISFLLLNRQDSPHTTLAKLDVLLDAAHMRLIIFLEDLDRKRL